MSAAPNENEHGLARKLGLSAATLTGLGVILGAGIYVLVGVAAGAAGNAVWLSFLFAALGASLTGLSYARLSRLRPKDAPEFQYVSMAFGRRPAFLAGWLVLWASIISCAVVSLGFGSYLAHLVGLPVLPSALGLVLVSAVVVFVGVGQSAILAGALTFVAGGGLLVIIAAGIPHFGRVNLMEMPLGVPGVISASSLVFFAYLGFEGMANLSEEMKDPERDLPRAIILSLAISTVLYALVTLSAVSVLGWSRLSQSSAPLAEVASRTLGAHADWFLTFTALASTANTVLILLLAASRAMWAMSCAGVLPMSFCVIGKHRRTPWLAIVLVAGFAGLFASIGNIGEVATFTNFATLVAFAAVNASALKVFAGRSPGRLRNLALGFALPGLGAAFSVWLAANAGWRAALVGSGLVVAGVIVYWAMSAGQRANRG